MSSPFELGQSLLQACKSRASLPAVEDLLARGAPVTATSFLDETPLSLAIDSDNLPVIECLLRHNANVDAVNIFGRSPVHRAVRTQCTKRAWWRILSQIYSMSLHPEAALRFAACHGHYRAVVTFIEAGADVGRVLPELFADRKATSRLRRGNHKRKGMKRVVSTLMACGATVDKMPEALSKMQRCMSMSPLEIACLTFKAPWVEAMLRRGLVPFAMPGNRRWAGRANRTETAKETNLAATTNLAGHVRFWWTRASHRSFPPSPAVATMFLAWTRLGRCPIEVLEHILSFALVRSAVLR